jgi:hypothetical protein
MRIQQIENAKPIAEIVINDFQVISGVLPGYLQRSADRAMREGRLTSFMRYTCAGVGNQLSLNSGSGLKVLPEATLDADDPDLPDMLTDRAQKKTQAAIDLWKKSITAQVNAWTKEGVSLAEIRDRIPQLYTSINNPALVRLVRQLHQSMQLGYLGGRAEVLDETDGNDNDGVPK